MFELSVKTIVSLKRTHKKVFSVFYSNRMHSEIKVILKKNLQAVSLKISKFNVMRKLHDQPPLDSNYRIISHLKGYY